MVKTELGIPDAWLTALSGVDDEILYQEIINEPEPSPVDEVRRITQIPDYILPALAEAGNPEDIAVLEKVLDESIFNQEVEL